MKRGKKWTCDFDLLNPKSLVGLSRVIYVIQLNFKNNLMILTGVIIQNNFIQPGDIIQK